MKYALLRRIHPCLLLGVVLLCLNCGTGGRQIKYPDVKKYTTRNGLDVYVWSDARAPIFMQQFWFKVGSANERQRTGQEAYGTTGLSHFFEHLMFRGTQKFPNYFEGMARMGGQVNAFTWLDETTYWEKLPSRYLEKAIEMEADRIQNLKMDFLNLEPEREVVKSERLMRTDNSPQGLLSERVTNLQYQNSPYQWPTVGWMDDLIAVQIGDAEAYFKKHYIPNNAFAVYVGNVDGQKVMEYLNDYLGDWPRGPQPKEPDMREAQPTEERRTSLFANIKAPVVEISFLAPTATSEDWVGFEVLDAILTRGRSSLLLRELVYGPDPVATGVSSFLFALKGRPPYSISIQGLSGTTGTQIVQRVQKILDDLSRNGVDQKTLSKAVRALRGKMVRYMKSVYGRAHTIGFWIRATGDPLSPFRHLSQYGSIDSADVQRLTSFYLAKNRRTVGTIVNPSWLLELAVTESRPKIREDLKQILQIAEQARRLAITGKNFRLEQRAIELLIERSKTAHKRYTDEGKTKELGLLKKFLAENEKGPVQRQKKLDRVSNQFNKAKVQVQAATRALQLELSEQPDSKERALQLWLLKAARGQTTAPTQTLGSPSSLAQTISVAYGLKAFGSPDQLTEWLDAFDKNLSPALNLDKSAEKSAKKLRIHQLLEQLRPLGTPSRTRMTGGDLQ